MSLYQHEQSKFWWCRFKVRGRTYRLSTEETDRRTAAQKERAIRAEIEAASPRASGLGTLEELRDADMERARQVGATAIWVTTVEQRWDQVFGVLGANTAPADVTKPMLDEYIGTRRKAGIRGQTIRRELQALHRGLAWAKNQGWVITIPDWPRVKSDPPKASQRGKPHDPKHLRAVIEALPHDAAQACRFCLLTGLRFEELKRVRWSWARELKGIKGIPSVLVLPADATKSRRERKVGLSAPALAILKERHKAAGDLVFPRATYRKALQTAGTQVGYAKRVTMRDLRHMFATTALKETGNLAALAKVLGHATVEMTSRYMHADEDDVLALSAATSAAFKGVTGRVSQAKRNVSRLDR